ncbi:SDR family NAD(P)-dependent oxidoreductase [Candidatus Sumerlaeota bacterium]|nr:SDR family NAD(P)-dependent oxidoreductase [Candidatus Sumerlaeota bacterium]
MDFKDDRAVVIGASSGIGAAVARRLALNGWHVALVARREDQLKEVADHINQQAGETRAHIFAHDVVRYEDVPALFDRIVEHLGGLGMVVYAAGVMPTVGPSEYNFEKDKQMVEVNLLGMIAWLNQAADLFARLQKGTIVGIGSIAGDRGRKGQPVYNTTKGAQAIYLDALRNRLAPFNVRVVTIKPGFVDTAMTQGLGNMLWMISPEEAGRKIVKEAARSKGTVYVPARWGLVSWIITKIPSFIFKRLDI